MNFSERVSKSLKEFIKNVSINKNTINMLNNIGINVYDENGKIKTTSKIFDELSEKINKLIKKGEINEFK